jgi:hypothetical protein
MGAPVATSSGARAASAQAGTGRLEIRMSLPLPLRVGPPRETADGFLAVVKAQIPERARRWLASALTATSAPLDRDGFATAFALATRQAGQALPALAPAEAARLRAAGVTWPIALWGLDGVARAALLLRAAAALSPGEVEALVEQCYFQGDTRERQAVLRTLPLLPDPARFVPLGVEACRTSVQPVFEAIACENPFPAAHFPEASFNQMVLKAIFIDVAARRILGLEGRITPELRRMAADYASERRAAGRSVPEDVAYLMGENGSRS